MQDSAIPKLQIMGFTGDSKDALLLGHQNSSERKLKHNPLNISNTVFTKVYCQAQQLVAL
jgi:hypothetical protein